MLEKLEERDAPEFWSQAAAAVKSNFHLIQASLPSVSLPSLSLSSRGGRVRSVKVDSDSDAEDDKSTSIPLCDLVFPEERKEEGNTESPLLPGNETQQRGSSSHSSALQTSHRLEALQEEDSCPGQDNRRESNRSSSPSLTPSATEHVQVSSSLQEHITTTGDLPQTRGQAVEADVRPSSVAGSAPRLVVVTSPSMRPTTADSFPAQPHHRRQMMDQSISGSARRNSAELELPAPRHGDPKVSPGSHRLSNSNAVPSSNASQWGWG